MKTPTESIRRPLRRALLTLLFCIAALWAMPTSAPAQLYVGQDNYQVGAYDATTRATINAGFIASLPNPQGLALSDKTLFV
jgi:hypothetical protein